MIGIVFSRDRALQLDGTLRSFYQHCQDPQGLALTVLYKATSERHVRQYACLTQEYSRRNVNFLAEQSFQEDLLRLLMPSFGRPGAGFRYWLSGWLGHWFGYPFRLFAQSGNVETVLFLVDDNIFVRSFHLQEVTAALASNPEVIGVSLRLGMNTSYCYPLDKPQANPSFIELNERLLGFRWIGADGDYGYPLEVSSSVYRLEDILPVLATVPFDNPNRLEGQLAKRAKRFRRKAPELVCFHQSVTFCNPVNRVQSVVENRVGVVQEYSSEGLAGMFEAGYRLDVEFYRGFIPNACHQEVKLVVNKEK
jgi:hypothetical protein